MKVDKVSFGGKILATCIKDNNFSESETMVNLDTEGFKSIMELSDSTVISYQKGNYTDALKLPMPVEKVLAAYNAVKDNDMTVVLKN